MTTLLYELYNTDTEAVEATALLTPGEATKRNHDLRFNEETQRWIVAAVQPRERDKRV